MITAAKSLIRSLDRNRRLLFGRSLLVWLVFLCTCPLLLRAQSNAGEGMEFRGNRAEISVTVLDSSGTPVSSPAMVKVYKDGTPYDQGQTTRGKIFFILRNLGDFSVIVEAAGFKSAQKDISISMPIKTELEIRLQRDAPSNVSPGSAGESVLAPKAKEALDKGVQAMRDDKLDDAQLAMEQAMKLAPSNPDVLYADGVLELKRRDWAKAQSVLEKATQVDPNRARSFAALGMALCNGKKYAEAIAPLERALELDASSGWETQWSLAQSYYHAERYDDALKTAQLAQGESNGQAPQVDLLVAQSLVAVGRFEDSGEVLRAMLKRHNDGPEAVTARRFLERLTADGKIKRQ